MHRALDCAQFHLFDRRDVSAGEGDIPARVEHCGDSVAPSEHVEMRLTVERWDGPAPDDLADWQEGYLTGLGVDEHGLG